MVDADVSSSAGSFVFVEELTRDVDDADAVEIDPKPVACGNPPRDRFDDDPTRTVSDVLLWLVGDVEEQWTSTCTEVNAVVVTTDGSGDRQTMTDCRSREELAGTTSVVRARPIADRSSRGSHGCGQSRLVWGVDNVMTLFPRRRRLIEEPRPAPPGPAGSNGLAVRSAGVWRGRAVTAGLWGLVSLAAIGGTAGLVRAGSAPTVPVALAAEPVASAAVLGTAEWAVRTVLPAPTTDAAGVAVAVPARRGSVVADQAVRVVSTTAIAAVPGGRDGSWTVTVAAQVVVDPTGPSVWWFLTVGVVDTDTGPVVVSDPALIPAPSAAVGRVELAGSLRPPDDSDAAVATTVSFLTALLTGDPAVGRWTAPGFDVPYPAVGDGVFDDVTVERVATTVGEESRSVRAEVTATTASDGIVHLAYEVQVQVRSGRWEVTGFGPPAPTGADPIEPGEPPPPAASSSPTGPASDPVSAEPAPDVTGPSGATTGPSPSTSPTSTTPVTNGPPPVPEGET